MSEEPDFEARDQGGNLLWYKCHNCGHVWKAGQSGSHNCVDLLKPALTAALARAEEADRELARVNQEWLPVQAELDPLWGPESLIDINVDEPGDYALLVTELVDLINRERARSRKLEEELDNTHNIEAELITLKAQDRLDPLRLEMAEAEANGLRLLHESDQARIATLQSECARLEITKSLPLRLWCKAITTAASKDPTVIQHYTSLGGDVIGLEEHRQILAARLERFLRIFERDD